MVNFLTHENYFKLYFDKVEFESLRYFKKVKFEDSNYIKENISITIPPNLSQLEQDYLEEVSGIIKNAIQNVIFSDIKKTSNYDDNVSFFDIMETSKSSINYDSVQNMSIKLIHKIFTMNYKNIITNGKLLIDYISDSVAYRYEEINNVSLSSSTFQKNGTLFGKINVFMDVFMKYDEEFILTFDEVYFDIKEIFPYISSSHGNPQLKVEFKYFTNILNPSIVYIIDSESSTNYYRFKSERRNKTIDTLLKDDKGIE